MNVTFFWVCLVVGLFVVALFVSALLRQQPSAHTSYVDDLRTELRMLLMSAQTWCGNQYDFVHAEGLCRNKDLLRALLTTYDGTRWSPEMEGEKWRAYHSYLHAVRGDPFFGMMIDLVSTAVKGMPGPSASGPRMGTQRAVVQ